MTKKRFGFIVICVLLAAVAGYSAHTSMKKKVVLSELMLANIEALTRGELPEVTITCDQYGTMNGRCWKPTGNYCTVYEGYEYPSCTFGGYQYDACLSPCRE